MAEFDWNSLMATAEAGVTPVPKGEYEMQVATAIVKPTQGGKKQIQTKYNIIQGPHTGRTAFKNFVISPESPQSMGFFFRQMNAHGLTSAFFTQQPTVEQVAEALIGRLVHVNVEIEPYNGEDRNKLGGFSPSQMQAGGATPAVAAPAPLVAPAPAPTAAPAFPTAPPVAAPPMAPPVAPVAAAAPPVAPPPLPAPPMAPPVAAAPPAAPAPAPVPVAPPVRQFDPATGMEVINGAWAWPPEQAAGYLWNGVAWAPPAAPVAPVAPPMPPAPPTSF